MGRAASGKELAGLRRTAPGALELEPDDPHAVEQLGIVHLAAGDEDGARELFIRSDRARFGAAVQTRLCVNSLLDRQRAARGEAYVQILEDVLVDSEYWVVLDG